MKAVLLTRHGGADVLRIDDVPAPEPKVGEVRVNVDFIGVNFAEVLSRRGVYGWAPPLPYILGMEATGVLDSGERVIVGTQYGAYAEQICVPAERALPAPAWLSPRECAAFAVNYLTAWIGLMEMARLRPSDTLLVTAAAGGVGTAAVQIGSRFGAKVIGVASRGKHEVVRSLGASSVLGYEDDFPSADVVLEMAAGPAYRKAVRALSPMGRVVLAGASGAFARSPNPFARLAALRNVPWPWLPDMVRHSYGVMCFHVGWLLDAGLIASQWRALVAFAETHQLRPVIGEEFGFEAIADAHRALEERRNVGKVIVRLRA